MNCQNLPHTWLTEQDFDIFLLVGLRGCLATKLQQNKFGPVVFVVKLVKDSLKGLFPPTLSACKVK